MSEFSTARQKMVDGQVRPSDVTDLRILDAMLAVPREEFVPPAQRPIAYLDLDIEVGGAGTAKRYLIKPVVLAKMLQAASITEGDRVLVVGCASGYSAAIVAHLAGEVFATEPDALLANAAKTTLSQIGIKNVTVGNAEAAAGDAAHGPYDVIVLDGATEIEPSRLCEQLKPEGRLVGVFAATQPPRAHLVQRSAGDFGSRILFDAFAPVLPGMQRLPAFVF